MQIKGRIFESEKKVLTVENGVVTEMGKESGGEVLDFGDSFILPGFIDVHTHGAMGADTMDATDAAMQTMKKHMAKQGVTGFLPTTVTMPTDELCAAIRVAKANEKGEGADILGVHMEGPYFSPHNVGAQNPAHVRRATIEDIDTMLDAVPGFVKIMSLAPEMEGAKEAIQHLRSRGVVAAMGHTKADYETATEAIEWGVTQATHLFNCMTPIAHRAPGTVGAALENSNVYAELICDGVHVNPATAKVAIRAKGTDRVLLISDSVRPAGMPDGEYVMGGLTVFVKDKTARIASGNLAGSTANMLVCVQNVVNWGFSLSDAVRMASTNPAHVIGAARKGRIAGGFDADFTVLSPNLDLVATIVGGKVAYLAQ